jgi:hypothetical protein
MIRKLFAAAVAMVVVAGAAVQAEEIKSGPQAGEKVPGPFTPLNVNGDMAGQKACLYCKHGSDPVVAVFARCADCECPKNLVKKLEKIVGENSKASLGAYVVYLSDDDETEGKLKKLIEEAKLKNVTLSIDSPKGPEKYNLTKDADVTVLLYKDRKVVANYAFASGKMTDKDIETIATEAVKMTK